MEVVMGAIIILLTALMLGLFFILGALFMRHVLEDAAEQAAYEARRAEYYRLAGVRTNDSPKPYVPPRKSRSAVPIPYMAELERRLKKGKRGTILIRGGETV